jgi:hypothetical protein
MTPPTGKPLTSRQEFPSWVIVSKAIPAAHAALGPVLGECEIAKAAAPALPEVSVQLARVTVSGSAAGVDELLARMFTGGTQ